MSSENKNTVKEPLIRISKRAAIAPWKAWLIRLAAVVIAMIVSGIIAFGLIEQLQKDPSKILTFYTCFIKGSFSSTGMAWIFFKDTAILLCIGLAVTPAFRMKFWNIGAEGQSLMGVFGTIAVAHYLGGAVQPWLLIPLMLLAALICGGIWGLIPAIFKTIWNTNETLFTLMMNYVASFFVSFMLLRWIPNGTALGSVEAARLPVFFNDYLIPILAVAILTIVLYVYLNYTKHGYEISVVGGSENTARYVGINVNKVILRTMILSGVLCGFAGFLIGAGLDHSLTSESVGGQGFTAIMVSWLAKFDPLVMILTSGLIIFLERGADKISEALNVQGMMPKIVVGVIIFFIIGCEFFINYKLNFRKKNAAQD